MAATLSWEARTDAIAAGASNQPTYQMIILGPRYGRLRHTRGLRFAAGVIRASHQSLAALARAHYRREGRGTLAIMLIYSVACSNGVLHRRPHSSTRFGQWSCAIANCRQPGQIARYELAGSGPGAGQRPLAGSQVSASCDGVLDVGGWPLPPPTGGTGGRVALRR